MDAAPRSAGAPAAPAAADAPTTTTTTAAHTAPSENNNNNKAKRYDRQVRVWGPDGQARLERARVALLGAGPAGTETLKNLVLAGIAAFTVVDAAAVAPRDLGNNWLVSREHLGAPRARCVASLLGELNEDARGSYVEDDPEALLRREPAFVTGPAANVAGDASAAAAADPSRSTTTATTIPPSSAYPSPPFDLVVASGLREPALLRLDALCRASGTPLLAVRAYGLAGTVRLSLEGALGVWDSRPDSILDDLRACEPWPELLAHARATASADALAKLDDHAHRHVPYAAILVAAADAWRGAHGGRNPATADERAAFRAALNALRRRAPEDRGGAALEEENFDEALRAAFHAWTPARLPSESAAVLADPIAAADPPPADAPPFWLLAAALRAFVANEGGGTRPPLEGALPDMVATTAAYMALQRVYKEKAAADAAAVGEHLKALLRRLGRDEGEIGAEEVRRACRHARHVRAVRWLPLAEEWHGPAGAAAAEAAAMQGGGGGGGAAGNGGGSGGAGLAGMDSDGGGNALPPGDPQSHRAYHPPASHGGPSDRAGSPGSAAPAAAPPTSQGAALAAALADEGPASRSASIYILLRAADAFFGAHGRYPGAPPPPPGSPASSPPPPAASAAAAAAAAPSSALAGAPYEEDVPLLRALAQQLLQDLGAGGGGAGGGGGPASSSAPPPPPLPSDDHCAEVVRWGAAELHCVAAVVGGVAAQEATKVLTRAFVPAASTVVYDAIACTTWGFEV
jgi:amyloid beta precursor protein binding protein 1